MQARAGAIDELLASGALTDLSSGTDDIQAKLDKVAPRPRSSRARRAEDRAGRRLRRRPAPGRTRRRRRRPGRADDAGPVPRQPTPQTQPEVNP